MATGGIHYLLAPNTASTPYVVYSRVAPGKVTRPVLGGLIIEDDLWQIKAVVKEGDSATLGEVSLAQDILSAVETAINESLTLTGNTVEYCKRESDIPSMKELVNGEWFYSEGFNLRVQTS